LIWHYKADCNIKTSCFLGLALLFSTKLQNFARFPTNLGTGNLFAPKKEADTKELEDLLSAIATAKKN